MTTPPFAIHSDSQINPTKVIEKRKNSVNAKAEIVNVMNQIAKEMASILLPNDWEWLLEKLYLKLSKSYDTDKQKRSKVLERFAEYAKTYNCLPDC